MSRRVLVLTGTRAEYGLFHPLLALLEAAPDFDVALLVTGTHLSERFGMTVNEIEADGHRIAARVELPLEDDSPLGVARATGAAVAGIAEALAAENPDVLVVLGDRYEALAAATAAALLRVPVAHLHGGEITEGAIDDSVRHAITKLAALHFVATDEYAQRVIRMGERPDTVFVVGALGVDNALQTHLIADSALASELGFEFVSPTALTTFHPVTLDDGGGLAQMEELLAAFDAMPELRVLVTMPNADAGNQVIAARLAEWTQANATRAKAFPSLGRVRYLSAMAASDVVVGNSSSGIIEAPSFGKPTVDIGDRQAGRTRAASVIHAEPDRTAIVSAIRQALGVQARELASKRANPYGDGHAAERIASALARTVKLTTRKRFYDSDDSERGAEATPLRGVEPPADIHRGEP